jgi:predicted nucleic acid-binding protein
MQIRLELAANDNLYAYDAYFLACARWQRTPLLSKDKALPGAAKADDMGTVEVQEL